MNYLPSFDTERRRRSNPARGLGADRRLRARPSGEQGEALLAPQITRRLIAEFARRPLRTHSPEQLKALTGRELEVLKLVARGLSNAEIADELYVSETTVRTHVGRILMKLALRDRVQAVVMAYETGLIQPRTS